MTSVWHQTQFVCSEKDCNVVSADIKGWRVIQRYKLYFCPDCCKKHKGWLKAGKVVK